MSRDFVWLLAVVFAGAAGYVWGWEPDEQPVPTYQQLCEVYAEEAIKACAAAEVENRLNMLRQGGGQDREVQPQHDSNAGATGPEWET